MLWSTERARQVTPSFFAVTARRLWQSVRNEDKMSHRHTENALCKTLYLSREAALLQVGSWHKICWLFLVEARRAGPHRRSPVLRTRSPSRQERAYEESYDD